MSEMGVSSLLKLILVLFLSVQDGPRDAGRGPALEALTPAGAVGFATLDVAQLRALIRDDPELAKALFAGRTAEASYGEAIEAMSERTKADPGALREAVARVRTIGLWVTGLGRQDKPRFVAVFDRGGAPDILPKLLGGRPAADRPDTPRTVTYAGRTLYAVGGPDARDACWFTEINGLVVLASDLLAAEGVLLKARSAAIAPAPALPAAGAGAPQAPLLQVRADVGAVVNGFLPAMGRHDQAEFQAAGAFFDLPAWRNVTLRMDAQSAVLRAEFDPNSALAAAVRPPERPPALLGAIPADTPLALTVSVRDAAKIWDLFEAGFSHLATLDRGAGPRDEFIRDVRRGTGLDVQMDLVSNVVAAAVVLTDPAQGLDLARGGALYIEGRDPAQMLTSVRVLMSRVEREDKTEVEDRQGVKIWRTGEALIALKGPVVMVAPARGDAKEAMERSLQQFIAGGDGLRTMLATRQPGAAAFATLDGARVVPQAGLQRLTAGLAADSTGLTLRIEGGGMNLAAGIVRLVAGIGRSAAAQAAQNQTLNNLRMVYLGSAQYEAENAKMPAGFADIKTYIKDADTALRDARTGQPLVFNPAVAGVPQKAIKNPSTTVLAYTPPTQDGQAVCVSFCDGHVQMMTAAQLQAALRAAANAGKTE